MSVSYLFALLVRDPLIILATAVMGTISLIVALWDRQGNAQLKVARAWAWMLLRIAGTRVTVVGRERIVPGRSYVIVSNHVSYMDTPTLLTHLPVNFRFLAKQELFKIPFIGGHLLKAGHISVPLDDPRAALKVLSHAGAALKERSLSVLVFPEGGRTPTGEMQEFRDGAAYLAIKGGVELLPVALIGLREILPMGSGHMKPGRVTLRIGEPIDVSAMKVGDRVELTERLRSEIQAMQALGHAARR
jgi:1-acyl-sn-glycerol-3-phosphate acyltransferase